MSDNIDCRGLSCPEPVILSRQALINATDNTVTVTVSNAVARDNITRAAKSMGWNVQVNPEGVDFRLTLSK
jgi:tRNA 2-thiouridine synthesizing protein A